VGRKNALKFLCRLKRQPGIAEGDTQAMTDVMEVRATVERAAELVDGISKLTGLDEGVRECGLLVGELAAGRRVELAGDRSGQLARTLGVALGQIEITAHLVKARESEQCLGIGRVESDCLAETLDRVVELTAAFVENSDHVVHVGVVEAVFGQASKVRERRLIIALFEGSPTLDQDFAFVGRNR